MNYIFPESTKFYKEKQVTQSIKDSDFYSLMSQSEYSAISPFIKRPIKKLLELGCGLGRMSIYMNWMIDNPDTLYVLADGNYVAGSEIKYGWNPDSSFYNDLSLTEQFSRLNGLTNFNTFDISRYKLSEGPNKDFDFVMSFLSVGFHYPVQEYWSDLFQITTQDCMFVFGLRKKIYSIDYFKTLFKTVHLVQNNIDSKEEIVICEKRI